jgi:hypothetical protein
MRHPIDLPCDELGTSYLAGATTPMLAHDYGCSPATIAKRLRDCGIVLRNSRFLPITLPEAELRRRYLDERWPIAAIAAYFGVSASTIGNKRRAHGIPIRPRVQRVEIGNDDTAYCSGSSQNMRRL